LGLITALVTLGGIIAGLFAGKTASQNSDLNASLSSAQAANSSLSSAAVGANPTIASLQAQLSASPTSEPPTPATGTIAPTAPSVRHAGKITMYSSSQGGLSPDLDAPASDPTWKGNGGGDITCRGFNFQYGGYSKQIIVKAPNKPTYDSCKNSTDWSRANLSSQYLDVNDYICFTTGEGHYTIIQLLAWQDNVATI
jgi:hypothetical protein